MNEKYSVTNPETEIKNVERTHNRPTYIAPTDIYENEESLAIVMDVPGIDEKTIDIHLEKRVLTITGNVPPVSREGYQLLQSEYGEGDYQRGFAISEDVDTEKIEASFKNGVLTIVLPKEKKARQIPINVQ